MFLSLSLRRSVRCASEQGKMWRSASVGTHRDEVAHGYVVCNCGVYHSVVLQRPRCHERFQNLIMLIFEGQTMLM